MIHPLLPQKQQAQHHGFLISFQVLCLAFLSTRQVQRGWPKSRGQEAADEHRFNAGLVAWASSGAAGLHRCVGCWSKQAGDGVADSAVEWCWNHTAVVIGPWQVPHPSFWPLSVGPCSCFLLWQKRVITCSCWCCLLQRTCGTLQISSSLYLSATEDSERLGKERASCLFPCLIGSNEGAGVDHENLPAPSWAVTEKHWMSIFLLWPCPHLDTDPLPSTDPLSSARHPLYAKHGSSVLVFQSGTETCWCLELSCCLLLISLQVCTASQDNMRGHWGEGGIGWWECCCWESHACQGAKASVVTAALHYCLAMSASVLLSVYICWLKFSLRSFLWEQNLFSCPVPWVLFPAVGRAMLRCSGRICGTATWLLVPAPPCPICSLLQCSHAPFSQEWMWMQLLEELGFWVPICLGRMLLWKQHCCHLWGRAEMWVNTCCSSESGWGVQVQAQVNV